MNDVGERCRAYATVARAFRFVRLNTASQPDLQQVADLSLIHIFHVALELRHQRRVRREESVAGDVGRVDEGLSLIHI